METKRRRRKVTSLSKTGRKGKKNHVSETLVWFKGVSPE